MTSPSIYREPMNTKWRKLTGGVGGARGEPRISKLPQSRIGGSDARGQRTETASQPEEPVMKRSQRKRQRQISEMEHRGEELGRRRVEDLRESHSTEQSDRRSTANRRREEHTEQQWRIKRTDRAVPTAGRDVRREQCLEEVGSMTRNKDTESHRRMAAEGCRESRITPS